MYLLKEEKKIIEKIKRKIIFKKHVFHAYSIYVSRSKHPLCALRVESRLTSHWLSHESLSLSLCNKPFLGFLYQEWNLYLYQNYPPPPFRSRTPIKSASWRELDLTRRLYISSAFNLLSIQARQVRFAILGSAKTTKKEWKRLEKGKTSEGRRNTSEGKKAVFYCF